MTLNTRGLEKLLRLCQSIDTNPQLWTVYSDTFRLTIEEAIKNQQEASIQIAIYSGHTITNRFGNPMSRRGRDMNCKQLAWREKPHICETCGMELDWAIAHAHHVVQVSDGGSDDIDNLQLLCSNCHSTIHNGIGSRTR
jgi:hypothetical protein